MVAVYTINTIGNVAKELLHTFKEQKVFAFDGELGAGKTRLIAELCALLGVLHTVSSPTYSIINEYGAGNNKIYHLDLYRMQDEQEALDAGVEEALFSGGYCFAEWASKVPTLFPEDTVWVTIEILPDGYRRLTANEEG